MKSYMKNSKK